MRLQLAIEPRCALRRALRAGAQAALFAVLLGPTAARAEDRVDLALQYFVEPAAPQRLHVFHPQLDVNIDAHRAFSIQLGYNADVVSGATPRTYGASSGPGSIDVVSSATSFSDVRHQVHGGMELRLGPAAI